MTLAEFLAAVRDGSITLDPVLVGDWPTPVYRASNGWRVGMADGAVVWVEREGERVAV